MISFRHTIIHECQRMDLSIAKAVIDSGLDDLIVFGDGVIAFLRSKSPPG